MVAGQLVVFGIAVLMIILGAILCLYSIYDRRKTAEEQAKKIAEEVVKSMSRKEGITTSPIPLADLNNIIEAIIKIENPFMQVGVFLTVFGMLIMIISIFIPI